MSSGGDLSALMREAAASGSDEGNAGGSGEGKSLESQNETLRQRVAQAEKKALASQPYVNLILRLRDSGEVGQKIIQKLINGESLTDLEEKKVVDSEQKEKTPLTEERVLEILEQNNEKLSGTLRAQRSADKKNAELDKWASENLKGYDKLKNSPQWGDTMDVVLGLYHAQKMYIPDGKDHWEAIYERAYHTIVSEDPDIVKGKQPAAQTEAERLKDILAGGTKKPASTAATGDEDPFKEHPELKRELDFVRSIGSGTVGKSFARKSKMK
jgi:hypothetical protein